MVKKTNYKKIIKDRAKLPGALIVTELDLQNIKRSKVEWFDDRFYKIYLPDAIDPGFIKNIPKNLIYPGPENQFNVYLPSSTTIQGIERKRFIEKWRGDVGNKRADQIIDTALNKGSNIHNAIDMLVNGTDIIYQNLKTKNLTIKEIEEYQLTTKRPVLIIHDQAEMVQLARYQKLINILNPVILDTEQNVFNLSECYAGTLDQVWYFEKDVQYQNSSKSTIKINAGYYIIDLKTGKSFDEDSTGIQLSSYFKAYHDMNKLSGALGIHLNSNNRSGLDGVKIYKYSMTELNRNFKQFLNLKNTFFWTNKDLQPELFEFPEIITFEHRTKSKEPIQPKKKKTKTKKS